MLEPFSSTCVSTTDTNGVGNEVAFVPLVDSTPAYPASPSPSEAVSFLRVSVQMLKNCARGGSIKQLFKAIEWKFYAGSRGAISKDECPDWAMLVLYGFAREGNTHIHLNNLDLGGHVVLFEEGWLKHDPMMIAAWIIQAYFLRMAYLDGRGKAGRKAHLRLVSKLDCGGMCVELLAAAFCKTKSWASKMRRKLEKAGFCTYKRRFTWASSKEAQAARLAGEGDRYIEVGKIGKYLKEHVSECTMLAGLDFRAPYRGKLGKSSLEAYAMKKGRAA